MRGDRGHESLDHAFNHGKHIFPIDKRHLEIELRKFRLAITAQILIPHAARNLKVALIAGHHKQLLELLRALRKRVKLPRLDAAGHDIVTRPFRRGLDHDRSLDFIETLTVEIVADELDRFVPQRQVFLQPASPEIEIAVFQAQAFVGPVPIVIYRDGKRLGRIENLEGVSPDFDLAGNHGRVDHPFGPRAHHADDPDDKLVAQLLGNAITGARFLIDVDLNQARPVPQVDKDEPSEIAAPLHPSGKRHGLPDVGSPQFAAIVCLEHNVPSIGDSHHCP